MHSISAFSILALVGSTFAVTPPKPGPHTTASNSRHKPTPQSRAAPPGTGSEPAPANLLSGLTKFASLGVFREGGLNARTPDANRMWLGSDGKYKATFINEAERDAAVICWNAKGMWINANQPQIYVHLGAGEHSTVSIPYGFSGGCGVAFTDSTLTNGLLNESILEFTAKENHNGCFDVSREINMKGIVLSVQGSKCTSGLKDGQLACTFVCTAGNKCGVGAGDYDIVLGAEANGPCMVGKDPFTGDPSGGCQMGDGEHMKVTFHDSRNWPAAL